MTLKNERNRSAIFKISITAMVKLLILNMLSTNQMYGNQIIDGISTLLHEKWSPSPGTIYPLLRQLEDQNHIVGWWSDPVKRSTRYYKITDNGLDYLKVLKKNYQGPINDSIEILESVKKEIYI